MVTPKHITVQEVIADTCSILQKINVVLNDHAKEPTFVTGNYEALRIL